LSGGRELARQVLARGTRAPIARPDVDWGCPPDPFAGISSTLSGQVGIPTPPVGDVLLFLIIYVVTLVPGAALAFRAIRRLELFWLAVPAIAVAFSLWIGARARELYGGAAAVAEGRVVELGSGAD